MSLTSRRDVSAGDEILIGIIARQVRGGERAAAGAHLDPAGLLADGFDGIRHEVAKHLLDFPSPAWTDGMSALRSKPTSMWEGATARIRSEVISISTERFSGLSSNQPRPV